MSPISEIIREWFFHHKRDLPWRATKSPYHIWLSEIILQQTRVNQGVSYYRKFAESYPDVASLAAAGTDDILRLWQGLGYYSRARNMHATARTIVQTYQGEFPTTYDELLKLPGIGPYTAAAIASIAFDVPVAVVDGNVFRVLARLYKEPTVINSPAGQTVFKKLAEDILDHEHPGLHNQALMELGSLICLPKNPLCQQCPLTSYCKACLAGNVHEFPVKAPKKKVRQRFFNYLHFKYDQRTYMARRNGKDIWNSLFEFPLIETNRPVSMDELVSHHSWKEILNDSPFQVMGVSEVHKHQLTHQLIHATFYRIRISKELDGTGLQWVAVEEDQLQQYAVPRLIERYLHDLKQGGEV